MARDIAGAALSAITSGVVKPILFYEGEFASGTLRLFTGHGSISWNGETWTGDAGLLRFSSVRESSDLQAVNFTISLAGEVPSLISVALAQVRRGKPGTLWLGFLDANNAVIVDPILCVKLRADRPEIHPDPQACVISIAYESRLIDATKLRERRFTAQDQKIDYPTDTGFDHVPYLQDKVIVWGRTASRGAGGGAVPSDGPIDFNGGP